MPNIHIEIKPIKLAAKGALAVGTGFRRGLIHRTVAQDADGFAYIPASSFKGRVRRTCEQLAKTLGLYVCNPPQPARMCSSTQGPPASSAACSETLASPARCTGAMRGCLKRIERHLNRTNRRNFMAGLKFN